jgi:hypothetical protein
MVCYMLRSEAIIIVCCSGAEQISPPGLERSTEPAHWRIVIAAFASLSLVFEGLIPGDARRFFTHGPADTAAVLAIAGATAGGLSGSWLFASRVLSTG